MYGRHITTYSTELSKSQGRGMSHSSEEGSSLFNLLYLSGIIASEKLKHLRHWCYRYSQIPYGRDLWSPVIQSSVLPLYILGALPLLLLKWITKRTFVIFGDWQKSQIFVLVYMNPGGNQQKTLCRTQGLKSKCTSLFMFIKLASLIITNHKAHKTDGKFQG